MTLEEMLNQENLGSDYIEARARKVAEIREYLDGLIADTDEYPELLDQLAEEAFEKATELGRVSGNEVSFEINSRYTKSGNPLPATV